MKKILAIICCLIISCITVSAQESCKQYTHDECQAMGMTHDECDAMTNSCIPSEEPVEEEPTHSSWISFLENLIGLKKPVFVKVNKVENSGTINVGTINKSNIKISENNHVKKKPVVIKVNKVENSGTINVGTINKSNIKISKNNVIGKHKKMAQ